MQVLLQPESCSTNIMMDSIWLNLHSMDALTDKWNDTPTASLTTRFHKHQNNPTNPHGNQQHFVDVKQREPLQEGGPAESLESVQSVTLNRSSAK
jgi:hypothetical protein